MGADNSKPSDVSDKAWERVQNRKLDMIAEETIKQERFAMQTSNVMTMFNDDLVEYCSACHDVPKIMMVLPSYRERCAVARGRVLNNVRDIIVITANKGAGNNTVDQINKV